MNYVLAGCHDTFRLFTSLVKTCNTMLNLVKVSMCRGKGDKGSEVFCDVTLY